MCVLQYLLIMIVVLELEHEYLVLNMCQILIMYVIDDVDDD